MKCSPPLGRRELETSVVKAQPTDPLESRAACDPGHFQADADADSPRSGACTPSRTRRSLLDGKPVQGDNIEYMRRRPEITPIAHIGAGAVLTDVSISGVMSPCLAVS